MTNRERLAKMSNEELAQFICDNHTMCVNCIGQDYCAEGEHGNGVMEFLEAEAEEEA